MGLLRLQVKRSSNTIPVFFFKYNLYLYLSSVAVYQVAYIKYSQSYYRDNHEEWLCNCKTWRGPNPRWVKVPTHSVGYCRKPTKATVMVVSLDQCCQPKYIIFTNIHLMCFYSLSASIPISSITAIEDGNLSCGPQIVCVKSHFTYVR